MNANFHRGCGQDERPNGSRQEQHRGCCQDERPSGSRQEQRFHTNYAFGKLCLPTQLQKVNPRVMDEICFLGMLF